MGLLAIGINCLAVVKVKGLSLVPLPPLSTSAFIKNLPSQLWQLGSELSYISLPFAHSMMRIMLFSDKSTKFFGMVLMKGVKLK
jgi:hypothetical protein